MHSQRKYFKHLSYFRDGIQEKPKLVKALIFVNNILIENSNFFCSFFLMEEINFPLNMRARVRLLALGQLISILT